MTRSGVMRRKTHQKETTAPISDKRSWNVENNENILDQRSITTVLSNLNYQLNLSDFIEYGPTWKVLSVSGIAKGCSFTVPIISMDVSETEVHVSYMETLRRFRSLQPGKYEIVINVEPMFSKFNMANG